MNAGGPSGFPRYGELWLADLDPVVGSEIGKQRPVLVVSNNQSNQFADTVTVLPLTSQPPRRQYLHEVIVPQGAGGLPQRSRIKANMVRTVDKGRLLRLLGDLPTQYHSQIDTALKIHLNITA